MLSIPDLKAVLRAMSPLGDLGEAQRRAQLEGCSRPLRQIREHSMI